MKTVTQLLAVLVIALIVVAAYDAAILRPRHAIAVVDTLAVYREVQAEVIQQVAKGGAGASQAATDRAKRFEVAFPRAIEELPAECGCLVIEKAAVIGENGDGLRDLTPLLRQKVK